ncbi:hypothetical protein TDB9533_00246 [Thalassocella blandensis]|nr:hypothetical protein TDB9533_00246 [Thalassocella blandensis]
MFVRKLVAGWADMDFNSHMRNTAYMDKSSDVRLMYFGEYGFPIEEFSRRRIGPVVQKDEIHYFREINLMEEIEVSLMLAGLAEDGSKFRLRNEFRNAQGERAASVTSSGGWLCLNSRRLVAPPAELTVALSELSKTEDFTVLSSSIKSSE